MTGLSKITDKILAEANKDAEKILADADAECKKIAKEYKAKADKIKEDIEKSAESEASSVISRAKSATSMEQRNATLVARGQLIDKAFDTAKKELLSLPDDKYLDFLTSMLLYSLTKQVEEENENLKLYGEEDSPLTEKFEVILNEKDLEKFGNKLIENLRRRLIGKSNADILNKVELSKSHANIDGGLILKFGDIEINSSISMLFEQARPSLEMRVDSILFDNK